MPDELLGCPARVHTRCCRNEDILCFRQQERAGQGSGGGLDDAHPQHASKDTGSAAHTRIETEREGGRKGGGKNQQWRHSHD